MHIRQGESGAVPDASTNQLNDRTMEKKEILAAIDGLWELWDDSNSVRVMDILFSAITKLEDLLDEYE